MSEAKWCDMGQHAYPANQPGATTMSMTETQKNQWGGVQPYNVVKDVCAACSADEGLAALRANKTEEQERALAEEQRARSGGIIRRRAISNGPSKVDEAKARGYDPDYVKWLEDEAAKPLPVTDLDEALKGGTS